MTEKITLFDLASNLRQARIKGYAGGGKHRKLESGLKFFSYGSKASFLYEDYYTELFTPGSFAGAEVEYFQDQPVWYMIYCGAMFLPDAHDSKLVQKVNNFHKECLRYELQMSRDAKTDFRPRVVYQCSGNIKDIRRFGGNEMIKAEEIPVFYGYFIGGVINKVLFKD
jgi:hypothetical protein